jgi:hypothetical protein
MDGGYAINNKPKIIFWVVTVLGPDRLRCAFNPSLCQFASSTIMSSLLDLFLGDVFYLLRQGREA